MTALLILKSSETLAVSHEKKQWRNWGSRRPGQKHCSVPPLVLGRERPPPTLGARGTKVKRYAMKYLMPK